MDSNAQYLCVNCGKKVTNLYKKYSDTVLKLTECESCGQIADKYVEYDVIIVIIDLILLNTMAYRHILYNTEFKHFWKILLVLILLEAYSNMSLLNNLGSCNKLNRTEPSLKDFEMNVEDLKFYMLSLNIGISFIVFAILIYFCTSLYWYIKENKEKRPTFKLILKTVTLGSLGKFLQLPSIIWDITVYDYHSNFIMLYTTLSQLLVYRVVSSCPRIWCLIIIFSSLFIKSVVNNNLGIFCNKFVVEQTLGMLK